MRCLEMNGAEPIKIIARYLHNMKMDVVELAF